MNYLFTNCRRFLLCYFFLPIWEISIALNHLFVNNFQVCKFLLNRVSVGEVIVNDIIVAFLDLILSLEYEPYTHLLLLYSELLILIIVYTNASKFKQILCLYQYAIFFPIVSVEVFLWSCWYTIFHFILFLFTHFSFIQA